MQGWQNAIWLDQSSPKEWPGKIHTFSDRGLYVLRKSRSFFKDGEIFLYIFSARLDKVGTFNEELKVLWYPEYFCLWLRPWPLWSYRYNLLLMKSQRISFGPSCFGKFMLKYCSRFNFQHWQVLVFLEQLKWERCIPKSFLQQTTRMLQWYILSPGQVEMSNELFLSSFKAYVL